MNAKNPPNIKISGRKLISNIWPHINPKIMDPIIPPAKPSRVLLGLIFFTIKLAPNLVPIT